MCLLSGTWDRLAATSGCSLIVDHDDLYNLHDMLYWHHHAVRPRAGALSARAEHAAISLLLHQGLCRATQFCSPSAVLGRSTGVTVPDVRAQLIHAGRVLKDENVPLQALLKHVRPTAAAALLL